MSSQAISVTPELSETTSKPRIPSLDGLRAISIFLVVIGHASLSFPHSGKWVNFFLQIFGNSDAGVLIFFVISGFLITTLLLQEFEKTGSIRLSNFYLRRSFRIFPAFYCYMGVVFFLWMAGNIHLTWPIFGTAAMFLRNYGSLFIHSSPTGDWFVGHTWTLAVEEQFYWLWPICLIAVKPRRAILIAAVLIALAPVLRTSEYFIFKAGREQIPILLHTRMDSLMTGALAALLYKNKRFQGLLNLLYKKKAPLFSALFIFGLSPLIAGHFHGIYLLPVGWTLENFATVIILLWAIDYSRSRIGICLNSRLLVHVGVISYSLYLWQQLFLTNLSPFPLAKFPLNIILAIIAAEISYFVIERPILIWRRRLKPTAS